MSSEDCPAMLLHAEKEFPQPVRLKLTRCCPTMDLVAVITNEEQLDVYRFNGQRAFGLQRKNASSTVSSICWKYNGTYLALGWSDGSVEVISTETGSVLQQFRQVTSSTQGVDTNITSDIDCIGWGMTLTKERIAKLKGRSKKNGENEANIPKTGDLGFHNQMISLDDLLDRIPSNRHLTVPDELPDMLARLDVLSLFPKLPILPLLPPAAYKTGKHPAAELFSDHQSLDPALHSSTEESYNELDLLFLGGNGGATRLILYDSLNIGSAEPVSKSQNATLKYLQHTSHPYSHSHMLLAEVQDADGPKMSPQIVLMPLSLKFMEPGGNHLQIISSKTAQLELLLQYVSECIFALSYHWKHGQDLPKRFMSFVNETLEEKKEATLVQNLYHLAITGNCPPTIKEWLVDELAERGHKRWDHSLGHGYTKVAELTHENLLPAIDRCNVILNSLQGLIEFHQYDSGFTIPNSDFELAMDVIRCLRLLAHVALTYAGEEQRQFEQFSKWLRHEIDVQATDPNSASAQETRERDVGLDYGLLLAYIEGPLENSKLTAFIPNTLDYRALTGSGPRYDVVKKALDSFRDDKVVDADLLVLDSHFQELQRHCNDLVGRITNWLRSGSSMNHRITLETCTMATWDVRMVDEDLISTYVAVVPKDQPSEVRLHRIHHDPFDHAPTAIRVKQGTTIKFQDAEIMDLKFVDDEQIMLLSRSRDDSSRLLSLPYKPSTVDGGGILAYKDLSFSVSETDVSNDQNSNTEVDAHFDQAFLQPYTKHVFATSGGFKPAKIEVNGRKNRRICVVLGEDGRQMRIHDLDFNDDTDDWVDIGEEKMGGDHIMSG